MNCARALSDVEMAICAQKELLDLDSEVAKEYTALKLWKELFPFVASDQKLWLVQRRVANLKEDYAARLSSLRELQVISQCIARNTDIQILESCADASSGRIETCVTNRSETTSAMVSCTQEIIDAWTIILEYAYSSVRESAKQDSELFFALGKSHKSWIAFKDDDCKMQWTKYRFGTIRGLISVGCELGHLQLRALDYLSMISRWPHAH